MSLGNVLIFGDSYSTFEGYIPEGYEAYYSKVARDGQGVDDVTLTWWHKLITQTESKLIMNNSWSGSTVGFTGYNNADTSKTSSFICRAEALIAEGFFEKEEIDTVIVFGGTNDSWALAPVGELKFDGILREDLYSVLPSFCYLFGRLGAIRSLKRIIAVINTELDPKIAQGVESACEHYGITCVALKNIDKIYGHPTSLGMEQIGKQIIEKI